jgi:hypothetical protein
MEALDGKIAEADEAGTEVEERKLSEQSDFESKDLDWRVRARRASALPCQFIRTFLTVHLRIPGSSSPHSWHFTLTYPPLQRLPHTSSPSAVGLRAGTRSLTRGAMGWCVRRW